MQDAPAIPAFGPTIWHGCPVSGSGVKCKDEIELLLVERGAMTCQIGLQKVKLEEGGAAVFWAITPHRVLKVLATTLQYKVGVPVPDILQWQLPNVFTQHLLGGWVIVDNDPGSADLDRALFRKWLADFEDPSAESRKILRLELEARLRRLARGANLPSDLAGSAAGKNPASSEIGHAMAMGRFIAEHYTEPLHDADIAHAASLNPQYAMRLFSGAFGVSMHKHLNDYRIAHACHLLATTNQKVIDVALDSGFGSVSRFYESFSKACGQSPQEYRAAFSRRPSA